MQHDDTPKLIVIAVLCSVMFFIALTIIEIIPEIPVDIDFKPFFIPLAFVALVPKGRPAFAAALGATLGEFMRDMFEGYELDDPLGAVAYVLAFFLAAYVVGNRPLSKVRLILAAVIAGFVQAAIEASSFIIFDEETAWIAVMSALGNTFTHGVVMGAIPLVFIVPRLYGRVERYMGFAPRGLEEYDFPTAVAAKPA